MREVEAAASDAIEQGSIDMPRVRWNPYIITGFCTVLYDMCSWHICNNVLYIILQSSNNCCRTSQHCRKLNTTRWYMLEFALYFSGWLWKYTVHHCIRYSSEDNELMLCRLSSESKKCHPTFVHNFGKCQAISKILSLLNSARNLQHCYYNISHRTLNMSLCCLEKCWIFTKQTNKSTADG